MRIGFDVSQTAEDMAGCGVFGHELLTNLVQVAPSHTFLPYPIFDGYRHAAFKKATRPGAPNVEAIHHGQGWRALNAGWDTDGDRHEFLGRPDIVHANNFGAPARLGAPLVYTVYDLSQIELPEYHTEANRLVCFNGLFDASLRAAAFIAISSFTRERFLYWFPHVRPERVSIVRPAARSAVAPSTDEEDHAALNATGLRPGAFWLAVGTIEPRKNYASLLEAYAQVCATDPSTPVLCIAGQAGWKESSLEGRIRALALEERVRCLGYVPDRQLASLYKLCLGFVFPSHYEGFGLPIIEALACGAAVIASRAASVPEVLGDAGLLIDPGSTESIAEAMRRLTRDADERRRLQALAPRQAARFSWRQAALDTIEVYERVLREQEARMAGTLCSL